MTRQSWQNAKRNWKGEKIGKKNQGENDDSALREVSATTIQAVERGNQARRKVSRKQTSALRESAATTIQAAERGNQARRKLTRKKVDWPALFVQFVQLEVRFFFLISILRVYGAFKADSDRIIDSKSNQFRKRKSIRYCSCLHVKKSKNVRLFFALKNAEKSKKPKVNKEDSAAPSEPGFLESLVSIWIL